MAIIGVLTFIASMLSLYILLKIAFTLVEVQDKVMASPVGKFLSKFAG